MTSLERQSETTTVQLTVTTLTTRTVPFGPTANMHEVRYLSSRNTPSNETDNLGRM